MRTIKMFIFKILFKHEAWAILELRDEAFCRGVDSGNYYLGRKSAFDTVIRLLINKDF